MPRTFEIRPVWNVGDYAESRPLAKLDDWTKVYGRAPDAYGIYENEPDGTLAYVEELANLPAAQRHLPNVTADLNKVPR